MDFSPLTSFSLSDSEIEFIEGKSDYGHSWASRFCYVMILNLTPYADKQRLITNIIVGLVKRRKDLNNLHLYIAPGDIFGYPAKSPLELLVSYVSDEYCSTAYRLLLIKYLVNNTYCRITCSANLFSYIIGADYIHIGMSSSIREWLIKLLILKTDLILDPYCNSAIRAIISRDNSELFQYLTMRPEIFQTLSNEYCYINNHGLVSNILRVISEYKATKCLALLESGPSMLLKMLYYRCFRQDPNRPCIRELLNLDVIKIICYYRYRDYFERFNQLKRW